MHALICFAYTSTHSLILFYIDYHAHTEIIHPRMHTVQGQVPACPIIFPLYRPQVFCTKSHLFTLHPPSRTSRRRCPPAFVALERACSPVGESYPPRISRRFACFLASARMADSAPASLPSSIVSSTVDAAGPSSFLPDRARGHYALGHAP